MSDFDPFAAWQRFLNEGSVNEDVLKDMGIDRAQIKDQASAARAVQRYVSQVSFASKALQSILDRLAAGHANEDVKKAYEETADKLNDVIHSAEELRRTLHTLTNAHQPKTAGPSADDLEKQWNAAHPNRGYRSDD
jgi:uncharacterized protein (DUF433 family)